jgi:branched-subunit amino acid ABC-type transport system permease component
MDVDSLVLQTLVGISAASSLFVVAAGLTLVFGAMRVVNVAHGSFYMVGAYLATSIITTTHPTTTRFWLGLVLAPLVVGAVGLIVEVVVLRRIYGAGHLSQLIATLAVLFIFADLTLYVWGGDSRSVLPPPSLIRTVSVVGGRVLPVYDIFVFGIAVLVGVFLWYLLRRTRLGWQIRATVDDDELLRLAGVDTRRLATKVFVLGAMLSGLAGAIVAPQISVAPGLDTAILIPAFIIAVIGGLGSVLGAALGALLVGLAQSLGALWLPDWSSTFIYIVLIAVLVLRPTGLLGRPDH